jgi:hypothetical protein
MIPRLSRWLALASGLALSACAANTVQTMPSAQGLAESASAGYQSVADLRVLNANMQPNVTCPKRFSGGCYTVSKSKSVELGWCYGKKGNECEPSNAGDAKWSGLICLAKGKGCPGPIKELTAKWTGPFSCSTYHLKCKGTFELDTITPGPGLSETKQFLYKQVVRACGSLNGGTPTCSVKVVGMNVGP